MRHIVTSVKKFKKNVNDQLKRLIKLSAVHGSDVGAVFQVSLLTSDCYVFVLRLLARFNKGFKK